MVLFGGAFGIVALAVWIFCIIDAITTPRDQVRNLPKLVWILVVVLFVDIGSIAWLLAGRPWNQRAMARSGGGTSSALPVVGGRSRRQPARRPTNPDDDDEFLATLRRRADEQRRERGNDNSSDKPNDNSSDKPNDNSGDSDGSGPAT